MLIRIPRSALWIRIVSWVLALGAALFIAQMVFKFAYFASGMAALDMQQKRQREGPIPVRFTDPNAVPGQPAPRPPAGKP